MLAAAVGLLVVPAPDVSAAKPKTRLVSKTSGGQPADGTSTNASVSATGRFVAFESIANNLPGPDGVLSVYVRDRKTGKTKLVSRKSNGQPATGGQNRVPDVSGNGRFVAFESSATNLPGEGFQVYVRDRKTGSTKLVSKNSSGQPADDDSISASISGSGRYVAFRSAATNLPGGGGGPSVPLVYRHDLETGKTILLSRNSAGAPVRGAAPSLSGSGREVAFVSSDAALPGSAPGKFRVYVRDLDTKKTRLVSRKNSGGPLNPSASHPELSANGRVAAFTLNIAGMEGCEESLVYAHDRKTGKTRLASRTSSGVPADKCSGFASLSGDGRYVAFHSDSTNLPGAASPETRSYVHDRKTQATRLVSRTSSGAGVRGAAPRLSASGAWVSFGSNDAALPGGAVAFQVYVRGALV